MSEKERVSLVRETEWNLSCERRIDQHLNNDSGALLDSRAAAPVLSTVGIIRQVTTHRNVATSQSKLT